LKTINLVENEHLVVIVSDRNAPYEDSTVVFLVSPEPTLAMLSARSRDSFGTIGGSRDPDQ
jgi:hypothetical protein